MLRLTNLAGFGGAVDSTIPTITSASSTTNVENTVLAFSITTDEPSHITIGGTDAAKFELAANTFTLTHTLRWASNGTKNYEAPDDANTDNVYDITLTPTDFSGNVGTPQSFSVTVLDDWDWVDSSTWGAFTTASTGYASSTIRQVVPASALTQSGTHMRVQLSCIILGGAVIDKCYIGEKAASGDAYDMKASSPAPTQITFNSGSAGVTLANNSQVYSDAIAFAIDETKDYVLTAHFTSTTSQVGSTATSAVSGANQYQRASIDEAASADVSGYSLIRTNGVQFFQKIQVASS